MPNARNFATVDYSLVNVLEPETLWSKYLFHSRVIALNQGGSEQTPCVAPIYGERKSLQSN